MQLGHLCQFCQFLTLRSLVAVLCDNAAACMMVNHPPPPPPSTHSLDHPVARVFAYLAVPPRTVADIQDVASKTFPQADSAASGEERGWFTIYGFGLGVRVQGFSGLGLGLYVLGSGF